MPHEPPGHITCIATLSISCLRSPPRRSIDMSQLFPPRANRVAAEIAAVVVVTGIAAPLLAWALARTPAETGQYRAPVQPVPFAHALHATALQIECRYCHAGADRSAMAGVPPTQACVPCHVDSFLQTSLMKPVADSLATGQPLSWRRVTRLPDFVFFSHAAHVRHGVDCETCHGPVHLMSVVYQAAPLTMEWCLQCHRAPERYVRLRHAALSGWKTGDRVSSQAVATTYDLRRLTSCSTCHR